MSLNHT